MEQRDRQEENAHISSNSDPVTSGEATESERQNIEVAVPRGASRRQIRLDKYQHDYRLQEMP